MCVCGGGRLGSSWWRKLYAQKLKSLKQKLKGLLLGKLSITPTSIIIQQRGDGRLYAVGRRGKR